MACTSTTRRVTMPISTVGSDSTSHFITFFRMPVADAKRARLSVVMDASTGLLDAITGAIYGDTEDDLETASFNGFPGSPATPTTITADGQQFGASFEDLDQSKQIVCFGLDVDNASGAKREMALATLIIDLES